MRVDGEVAGLLKINFRWDHLQTIFTDPTREDDVSVFMHRSDGTAVINPWGGVHDYANEGEARIIAERMENGWIEDEHELEPTIMGYALVQPEKIISSPVQTKTFRKDVSGESRGETDWYVFVESTQAKAYAPLAQLTLIFLVGGVFLALAVVFMAGFAATTVTNPLLKLREATKAIASGNLNLKIGSDRKDEIGDVLRGIDQMAAQLQKTLASRDELNREISARKKTEEALGKARDEMELKVEQRTAALQESENRFHQVVSSIGDIVYAARADNFATTYVNAAIERNLGYTPEEWLADPLLWEKSLLESERDQLVETVRSDIEKLDSFTIEYRIWHKDRKRLHWLEDRISVERDPKGRAVTIYGTMTDITDRKQGEAELLKLSQAVEQSPAAVMITDTLGHIEYVNRKCLTSAPMEQTSRIA